MPNIAGVLLWEINAVIEAALPLCRSPRENGGSNGDAKKTDGSTGAVSPSSARSTPASGASGGGKKEEKAGEAAMPAKMSPPAARALAGLGKGRASK